MKVNDFSFSAIASDDKENCEKIVKFIERHEWLGKMPTRPTHRFVATYKGMLAGVVVMATPNSFSNLLGLENTDLEKLISRGACISWSPKNLASALIMFGIRWMVKNTGFRFFTAYSDVEAKELGTIYQACNFTYLGQNSGARFEYLDPNYPESGWFSDRQFRKPSQVKRYARELMIPWQKDWSRGDGIDWEKIPKETSLRLKAQATAHAKRCKKRNLPPKHKYIYILGKNKKETLDLRDCFKNLHPNLQSIPYPKNRGSVNNTAAKTLTRPSKRLLQNSERRRPEIETINKESPYITVKEIAAMMKVSEWTVYNLIKRDKSFPAINIGLKKRFIIEKEKLSAWSEKRSRDQFMKKNNLPVAEELFAKSRGAQ